MLFELSGAAALPATTAQTMAPGRGRRRTKVWELPTRWHCPLIGTCIPISELRRLSRRAAVDAGDMSDFTLHTVIVGHCDEHNEVAGRIQRHLDEAFGAMVASFAKARSSDAVLALWRKALAGGDVAGALWAAWSHPDLTADGGNEIYGDIHMLSHQVGAATRAGLRRLPELERDGARWRDEAAALRLGLTEAQRSRDRDVAALKRQLADAEARAALLVRRETELAAAHQAARDYAVLHERTKGLARRVETLEERNAANARRAGALELALTDSRIELATAEAALESALGVCGGVSGHEGCGRTCPAEAQLAGRCVLCIGGRTGLVDGYRRLVEAGGGRFFHHDGGQEESLHRIDAAVAGADAVICQAGCVSHAAYWRLKEACKKLGKPCVFLKSPGVTSFARGLAELAANGEVRHPH